MVIIFVELMVIKLSPVKSHNRMYRFKTQSVYTVR